MISKQLRLLPFLVICLVLSTLHSLASSWAHTDSDLTPDPQVTWGVLDNGFRYAIMHNQEPPGKISMRLFVDAGSLMEEDHEQGIAHFLEHVAFQGSDNFPNGELVKYIERIGMQFGPDSNAHTSLKETVYKLDLPENNNQYIQDGLTVMRDYAFGLLLEEQAINQERGIVLSEKTSGENIDYRTFEAYFQFTFPESKLSKRLPIGQEANINSFTQNDFKRFYNKWYRPERMTLIVVGDIDPQTMASAIEEKFSDFQSQGSTPTEPDLGKIAEQKLYIKFHPEPEATKTTISINALRPYTDTHYTKETYINRLKIYLANTILTKRLDLIKKRPNAPFASGYSSKHDILTFSESANIEVETQPNKLEEAFTTIEQELRRALEYGFTQSELAEATKKLMLYLEDATKTAPTRKSPELANDITRSIGKQIVFLSPTQELAIAREALSSITPKTIHEAFNESWSPQGRYIFVTGNIALNNPEETIRTLYNHSQTVPLSPPEETSEDIFLYNTFGKAGKIVDREYLEELKIHQVTFANNIQLNLKKTDFEANTVHIRILFGSGLLELPKENPGLKYIADETFILGGLQEHSYDEIERLMAGKKVNAHFGVESDAFILGATTSSEDLETQLKLLTAYIKEPGFREEALYQAHQQFDQIYQELDKTPEGVMSDPVQKFLTSNDPRFGFPPKQELYAISLHDVTKWLDEPLRLSALEISIVGDIDIEDTIENVAKTLGTLSTRLSKKPKFTQERELQFPKGQHTQTFSVDSTLPRSLVAIYWPTVDMSDISLVRRLTVLGSVFSNRLFKDIREKLGTAYSPYAYNHSTLEFTDYGYLVAVVPTEANYTRDIHDAVLDIAQSITQEGITEDEFIRTINPLLYHVKETNRKNQYWLQTVLCGSTEYPEKLQWAKTKLEDYESITRKEVEAIAKEFLRTQLAVSVIVKPSK